MENRKVASLRPHDKNIAIYGSEKPSEQFIESIRKLGVLEQILVTYDDRIISGHRRWDGAKLAGLDAVPVVVFPSRDEVDILEALVHANKHRVKTNEVIGREAQTLLDVERERAAARSSEAASRGGETSGATRRGENRETKGPENFPDPSFGDARDKVGEALGVSGKTAEKAAAVVKKIDELKAEGKEDEAEELRDTLNNKSVSAAFKATATDKPSLLCNRCQRLDKPAKDCRACETLRRESKGKKPKADKPKAGEPVLDPFGIHVAEKMLAVFDPQLEESRQEALTLCRRLSRLLNEYAASPAGDYFRRELRREGTTDADIRYRHSGLIELTHQLEQLAPYCSVCPYCLKSGKSSVQCHCCKGAGWVPAVVFEKNHSLPADYLAALEELKEVPT